MPDGGNPFFVISETNQLPYSVRVEDTDSLSIGREYRLTVLAHRVENTDLLPVFWTYHPTAPVQKVLGKSGHFQHYQM